MWINEDNPREWDKYDGDVELNPLKNWKPVIPTDPPNAEKDEVLFTVQPIKQNGVWLQQWGKRKMTLAEIENRDNPPSISDQLAPWLQK